MCGWFKAATVRASRSIHLPHATFADLGSDGVRAERGAGIEWHGLRETRWELDNTLAHSLRVA